MNIINNQNFIKITAITSLLALLSACSSSSDSDLTSGRGGSANSMLSLDITDAAVDDADEVWVEFTGISLQPSDDQERLYFTFDTPKQIDLLSLQGTSIQPLLEDVIIPSGTYSWIRLGVNADKDSILDSYIKLNDGSSHELYVPSGSQTGLKLNTPFTLITGAELNYTIDFDLRKSIVLTGSNNYKLKPTLRLINNATSATITGSVDNSLLLAANCSDAVISTGNAVYLFNNNNATPDDIDNQPEEPLTTSLVALNNVSGNYEYTLGFIPEGDYTITFTCQSDLDEPAVSDSIIFTGTSNVTLSAGQILNFNF